MTEKRSHNNDCGENSVTIVSEKKIEDDSSDSSSGDNVEIEGEFDFLLLIEIYIDVVGYKSRKEEQE